MTSPTESDSIDYKSVPEIPENTIVVHLSGGAGSAISAMRCVEWYGRDRVRLVFADTLSESPDAYALVDAVEAASGISIDRLSQGKDIWDVFDAFGVSKIAATGACKASVELKQKPLDAWMRDNFRPSECVIATGLTYEERHDRQPRLQNKLHPYKCFFPLNVPPILAHCDIIAELEKYGLPVSSAYAKGYSHDNCNGGCILAGLKQWAALVKENPEHFAYCESRERAFYEATGFSINRDRRGGTTKPYPLYQLRQEVEEGRTFGDGWRSTCSCMMTGETEGKQE